MDTLLFTPVLLQLDEHLENAHISAMADRKRDLLDPDFEPTDDELRSIEEAFAGAVLVERQKRTRSKALSRPQNGDAPQKRELEVGQPPISAKPMAAG